MDSCIAAGDEEGKFSQTAAQIVHTIGLMERRIFWLVFTVLGLAADFLLPIWWAVAATLPIVAIAWGGAYRSDWL